ncbi:MAG: GxxExxY protein [Gemmatimonadaceae bacterium]|nr:GxxExxY protein [Gemmatimonadaceae bacterium]
MRDHGALLEPVTQAIIGEALKIHRDLGPGLLESVYEALLSSALSRKGLSVLRQQSISFTYDGAVFTDAFRVDLLVENQVVVELKAVSRLEPVFARQLLTYLRLLDLPVGLLLNFGAPTLLEGIKRVVNTPRGHHSNLRGSVSPCERS